MNDMLSSDGTDVCHMLQNGDCIYDSLTAKGLEMSSLVSEEFRLVLAKVKFFFVLIRKRSGLVLVSEC